MPPWWQGLICPVSSLNLGSLALNPLDPPVIWCRILSPKSPATVPAVQPQRKALDLLPCDPVRERVKHFRIYAMPLCSTACKTSRPHLFQKPSTIQILLSDQPKFAVVCQWQVHNVNTEGFISNLPGHQRNLSRLQTCPCTCRAIWKRGGTTPTSQCFASKLE